ncbi:MAG: divergent polysaccharide deacetylase family protein [Desulfuromonas sp.]|nr:divergent polysaccharide deacetylase family protein [Desulfuromonas sp.]
MAILFLATIIAVGLFIITNWPAPAPTAPADLPGEQVHIPPHYPENPPPQTPPQAPPQTPPSAEVPSAITDADTTPRIAIIIDDLGLNYKNSSAAIELPLAITCAIIPGEQHSTQIMELAHKHQHEIIVHLPMEPVNYPQNNPGQLALFTSQTAAEIVSTTQQLLRLIPYASGVNNHMGSAFTQEADKMDIVLEQIKARQLFFIDSLTIGSSVAYHEAQRLGVPTAQRDVFLDNERDVDKILLQLQHLISIATTDHSAIAIGHPYPETIAALTEFSAQLASLNIKVVPVSQLVH